MGAAASGAAAVGSGVKVGFDTVRAGRDVYGEQIADTWDKVDDWQEKHGLGGGVGLYYQAGRAKAWMEGKEYKADRGMSAESASKGWLRKEEGSRLYQLEQSIAGLKEDKNQTQKAIGEARRVGSLSGAEAAIELQKMLKDQDDKLKAKQEEKARLEAAKSQ